MNEAKDRRYRVEREGSQERILGTIAEDLRELSGVASRGAAYSLAKRLPSGVLVRLGDRNLRVNLPRLREWLDAGGLLAKKESEAA